MATTNFVDNTSIIYAAWLNDVNSAVYNGTFISSTITPTNIVCNGSVSGTGFSGLVNNTLSAPGAIGSATPNTGSFTTLSATTLTSSTPLGIGSGGTALSASGSAGNVLTSNGTVWASSPKITSSTAVASTSGTSIDFTGIPSWAKRITVMFNGVSLSGTAGYAIQIGSGSIDSTSTYSGSSSRGNSGGPGYTANTTSFTLNSSLGGASDITSGKYTIELLSGFIYVFSGVSANSASQTNLAAGVKTLSGLLDRVRITTTNGTDTFDAGSINIMYE